MEVVAGQWRAEAGWSPDPSAFAAGAADGGARTLVLFFADRALDPSAITELAAAMPRAVVVGCSTAGQILGNEVSDAPMIAAAIHFDSVTPRAAWASLDERASSIALGELVGQRLECEQLARKPGTVLVLADGSLVNGTALVDGLRSVIPFHVGISGGLAGDGDRFEQTWVYADGAVRTGAVAGVALVGDRLTVGYGSEGGWEGFGPFRTVTASRGNVLSTLDDQSALDLYREYLGERATDLPASALDFPLLIRSPDGSVELVRTVLGVDADADTMTFAGDVPVGWSARMMRTTDGHLVAAASTAAAAAGEMAPRARLAVAVSCVGRRLVLGSRTDDEVRAVSAVLGADTALVGFYAYGEITQKGAFCDLHNQTMTLTTITEA